MRGWGWCFLIVGLGLMAFAFIFNVSAGPSLYGDAVANLDLMNVRQLISQTGGAFAIVGAIFMAAPVSGAPTTAAPPASTSAEDIFREQHG